MPIHDISLGINTAMPVWPGQPAVELNRLQEISPTSHANVSRLALSVHTGTHVDAPRHFIADGTGVDTLPLDVLTGRALVIHLPKADRITAAVLDKAKIPPRTRRLLIRTRNSLWWQTPGGDFHTDFVGVAADAAQWLVDHKVELIGVDYLSVAPWKESYDTHRILLFAGIVVVEGLNLHNIKPGRYTLTCLPLKLEGCDGAPARAILQNA
ncbi:MAG: cyclase family protein [Anaerolineales bacterium]